MSRDVGRSGADAPSGCQPSASAPPSGGSSQSGIPNAAWPDELTPDLADILGRQCFTFIKFAQVYRAAGFDIPTRAEAEQAFFLHRFLGHWFRHGGGWLAAAEADLREVHTRAAQAIEARRAATGTGAVEDESAVGNADAPSPENPTGSNP